MKYGKKDVEKSHNPYEEKIGARVSSNMTELKKEVQAGRAYRILANESSVTVGYDIVEIKN